MQLTLFHAISSASYLLSQLVNFNSLRSVANLLSNKDTFRVHDGFHPLPYRIIIILLIKFINGITYILVKTVHISGNQEQEGRVLDCA
jgi:hypothetical protein